MNIFISFKNKHILAVGVSVNPKKMAAWGSSHVKVCRQKKINVRKFIEHRGLEKFVYVYDFGDDLIHQITVEQLTDEVLQLLKLRELSDDDIKEILDKIAKTMNKK